MKLKVENQKNLFENNTIRDKERVQINRSPPLQRICLLCCVCDTHKKFDVIKLKVDYYTRKEKSECEIEGLGQNDEAKKISKKKMYRCACYNCKSMYVFVIWWKKQKIYNSQHQNRTQL